MTYEIRTCIFKFKFLRIKIKIINKKWQNRKSQGTPVTNLSLKMTKLEQTVAKKETIDFTFQVCYPLTTIKCIASILTTYFIFIGYSGYVPGIKSENYFGESYGKATGASVQGAIK